MVKRCVLAAALTLAAVVPAWAGFFEGIQAAEKEDWPTAMKEWLPLANEGNPGARSNVADLYFYGLGVDKNEAEAFKWHALAAEQGIAKSQLFLAVAYAQGEMVAKDPAAALKWAFLARRFGAPDANNLLFGLIQGVDNDERVAIERAAATWKPKE